MNVRKKHGSNRRQAKRKKERKKERKKRKKKRKKEIEVEKRKRYITKSANY